METPLMVAARLGLVEEAQLLIGLGGADVNYEDDDVNCTPLECAVRFGWVAVAEVRYRRRRGHQPPRHIW